MQDTAGYWDLQYEHLHVPSWVAAVLFTQPGFYKRGSFLSNKNAPIGQVREYCTEYNCTDNILNARYIVSNDDDISDIV